jgi:hypothetical protein
MFPKIEQKSTKVFLVYLDTMVLIIWSLVLVSKLVTTTYCSSHYNLPLMAGRLAPASEVAGGHTILF